jgi:hypothetical protein
MDDFACEEVNMHAMSTIQLAIRLSRACCHATLYKLYFTA